MGDVPEAGFLGTKALGRAVEKSVDGVGHLLGAICMPVAEELGLFFQDKVRRWRAKNAEAIAQQAATLIDASVPEEERNVHPLLAWRILETGSFADTPDLQGLWAGLLASSCDADASDANLVFVDILSQLSAIQARILQYACRNTLVQIDDDGLVHPALDGHDLASKVEISLDGLRRVAQFDDLERIDLEIDRMRDLGLFVDGHGGIDLHTRFAMLTPSPVALHLVARCSGHRGPVGKYYEKQAPEYILEDVEQSAPAVRPAASADLDR